MTTKIFTLHLGSAWHSHGTLSSLRDRVMELQIAETVSPQTGVIRRKIILACDDRKLGMESQRIG